MKIINESEIGNRSVLDDNMPDKNMPPIAGTGTGNVNFICGSCGKTLAENLIEGNITGIVVRCQICKEYNLFE
ncbi:MAG: hypothetical protein ACYDEF_16310 [Methanosarcina sp.]